MPSSACKKKTLAIVFGFAALAIAWALRGRHFGWVALSALVALAFFFFNDTATTEIYTLSLHDALPIHAASAAASAAPRPGPFGTPRAMKSAALRSEEHTSELQSRSDLVCRLLLAK